MTNAIPLIGDQSNDIPESDMGEHYWDVAVARVVEAIGKCMVGSSLEEQAVAALEACRYAELVEALRKIAEHKTEAMCKSAWEEDARTLVEVQRIAMGTLTKIGDRT